MQQTFDVACLFVGACSTYRRGRSGFRPFAVALECASPALMSLEFLPYHRGPGRALPRFFAMRDENFKMPVDTSVTAFYMPVRRPDGGIGRRASFRCWYSKGCGGSSPLLGTISLFLDVPERLCTIPNPCNSRGLVYLGISPRFLASRIFVGSFAGTSARPSIPTALIPTKCRSTTPKSKN